MHDKKYCYPNSNVLINKKNIKDTKELYDAEILYTGVRLMELQEKPIKGDFDLKHLCKIHKYIFQDLYSWAGKIRTIDIGKGNMFCYVQNINDYAETIFQKYFSSCYEASIIAFNKADNSKLLNIFKQAVIPASEYEKADNSFLYILTSDDLNIEDVANSYEYYE